MKNKLKVWQAAVFDNRINLNDWLRGAAHDGVEVRWITRADITVEDEWVTEWTVIYCKEE
jgi:hypothetical protein